MKVSTLTLLLRAAFTKKEIDVFYKLFSKEAFWAGHIFFADKVRFNHEQWEQYVKVNRLFAERAAAQPTEMQQRTQAKF